MQEYQLRVWSAASNKIHPDKVLVKGILQVQSIWVISSDLKQTRFHPLHLLVIVILVKICKAFAVFFEIQEVCPLQFLEMVGLSSPGHPHSGTPLFWCIYSDILDSRFYCTVNRIVLVLCVPTAHPQKNCV